MIRQQNAQQLIRRQRDMLGGLLNVALLLLFSSRVSLVTCRLVDLTKQLWPTTLLGHDFSWHVHSMACLLSLHLCECLLARLRRRRVFRSFPLFRYQLQTCGIGANPELTGRLVLQAFEHPSHGRQQCVGGQECHRDARQDPDN